MPRFRRPRHNVTCGMPGKSVALVAGTVLVCGIIVFFQVASLKDMETLSTELQGYPNVVYNANEDTKRIVSPSLPNRANQAITSASASSFTPLTALAAPAVTAAAAAETTAAASENTVAVSAASADTSAVPAAAETTVAAAAVTTTAAAVTNTTAAASAVTAPADPNAPQRNITASLKDTLLHKQIYVADVWEHLIQEGAQLLSSATDDSIVVMEVGMHKAYQCLQAAKAGLQAYCVEPSPTSFARVQRGVRASPQTTQNRVHLFNVAAGGTSEGTVPFVASGGTGDHVGQHDMWKMEETPADEQANDGKGGKVIQVPSMRLDDIVKQAGDNVFLLKVDTQGFEPNVFSGLNESLRQHKIKHILFEYWPRGMDLLAGKKDACIAAQLLQDFVDMGYNLYALGVEAHPKAPTGWFKAIEYRPLGNAMDNCLWYFKVEELYPSDEYKMGYWSDILAVAPDVHLEKPTTKVGRALYSTRSSAAVAT